MIERYIAWLRGKGYSIKKSSNVELFTHSIFTSGVYVRRWLAERVEIK